MTFAAAVTAEDVCDGLQQVLKDHLADTLEEQGAALSTTLPEPRSWAMLTDFRTLNDKMSPTVVVTSPGLEDEPGSGGDKAGMSNKPAASWRVRVHCVIRQQTYDATARLVFRYAAAIRLTVLRNRQLGGIARTSRWVDESYDALSVTDSRTIGACAVDFIVTVDHAVDPTPIS